MLLLLTQHCFLITRHWEVQYATNNQVSSMLTLLTKIHLIIWSKVSKWHYLLQSILEFYRHFPAVCVCVCFPHLTWLLEVLIGHCPGVSDLQQTGLHRHQIQLRAVALGVVHSTLAPAVVVPAHQLAFLIAANVAEGSLYKARPQILREDGLKTCSRDGNAAHDYTFEIPVRIEVISHLF